ncbi:MAG: hypothetical protein ABL949_05680 [Fimbriimonadaceae bacterium]
MNDVEDGSKLPRFWHVKQLGYFALFYVIPAASIMIVPERNKVFHCLAGLGMYAVWAGFGFLAGDLRERQTFRDKSVFIIGAALLALFVIAAKLVVAASLFSESQRIYPLFGLSGYMIGRQTRKDRFELTSASEI